MKSNNFTQALKELTGFDAPEQPSQVKAEKSEVSEPFTLNDVVPEKIVNMSETEVTHVTSTMVINGDIKSEDNLQVEGQVYGDIVTSANLTSTNLIIGNLRAQDVALNGSRLKGNINLGGHLNVAQNTIVIGDIACDSLKVSGKIKGNLDVTGSVVLRDRALVSGNIVTDDIASEPGTRINGMISLRSDNYDLDAEFDFGGDF
ncbi:MAG: polymer-forming cytoskeletal protein [Firmicutes bacterium]|nr:polymer-forming cytoskeletal protein [Bacillota bacterium]